ncbi:alpha/beta fold hydrolase [Cupriavidus malaysiensis]|uniref:alpha/beta fold hydrolase n=1 Tax=Cupriavidus malaysiensis TaxID=367825 RepID=UPI000A04580F|nr:alpha/beta fold hydrolase [Cupriavidus malaysiensis]
MTPTPGAGTGALLIHGLGGTQFDLGPLHKALRRAGVQTHAVTLPGHGSRPEDLVGVRAEDWLDTVLDAYDELVGQYETFHVMGMCLGGLLAAQLCERRQHRKGRLVTLAAPVYIDGWSTPWYRWLRYPVYRIPGLPARMRVEEDEPYGIKNDLVRAIVKAKFERGDNFHYRWVPLACVRQVDRLRGWVLRSAHRIVCPTLSMHAREDELTSLRSLRFLARSVPGIQTVALENSYHMICVDNDREQVVSTVLGFFGLSADAASPRARRQARAEVEIPMDADAVRALADDYLRALTHGQQESLFPLLEPSVRWRHQNSLLLDGSFDDRDAVIAMFAQAGAMTGGTLRIETAASPRIEGQTVELELHVSAVHEGRPVASHGVQTLRLRNGRIATVDYRGHRNDGNEGGNDGGSGDHSGVAA